jgi:hypothetical protein
MKYKKGSFYAYPGAKLSLEKLQTKLAEMDAEIAEGLKKWVLKNPIADVNIPRYPPIAGVYESYPDEIPQSMKIPLIRFRRQEFRVVLWECLEGDEE